MSAPLRENDVMPAPGIAVRGAAWNDRYGSGSQPFFSVCIPQHNRTSFLIENLRVLARQTFTNWEVCISDDCSTDGREPELLAELETLRAPYVYYRQVRNGRYDVNLRGSISLASGIYCLLMGNDDCLAGPDVLAEFEELLKRHPETGVAMANYEEFDGSKASRRVAHTGVAGSGPGIAVSRFRNFSFVSGVMLRADRARAHATNKWDGSEMYQMYIGCRILAEGYALLEISTSAVLRSIVIPGESVDSYAARPRLKRSRIEERRLPLTRMGGLVYDAVRPEAGRKSAALGTLIFTQILVFTYPFWILEYRRVQSWRYAAGICLGMRPQNLLEGVDLPLWRAGWLRLVYTTVTVAGLLCPIRLFDFFHRPLYRAAKAAMRWIAA
jgi:glycosyltransferase involved in cell wall biosynthesis